MTREVLVEQIDMARQAIIRRLTPVYFVTLARFFLAGVLTSELLCLAIAIAGRVNSFIAIRELQGTAVVTCFLVALCILFYMLIRRILASTIGVIKSLRVDVVMSFAFGCLISQVCSGIGTHWYVQWASHLRVTWILALLSVPFVIWLTLLMAATIDYISRRTIHNDPFFINDLEKRRPEDDLLEVIEHANRFADRVLNRGSPDTIVFGIDAPWGIGKSTFVNFCIEKWNSDIENKVIVYRFSPLRFENRSNILDKFVDGLVSAIQKEIFAPELRPLFSKYARFISGKGKIALPGVDLELTPGNYSLDDAFDDLDWVLSGIKQKIVVVVDDLDRLDLSTIKEVLFAIKKSLTLKNVSYVLCYDTENIVRSVSEKTHAEKVVEFLEKFVNVKIGLYIDSAKLDQYISDNLHRATAGNSQADPALISKALSGLHEIFESPDYHRYLPFIGDIRKLKRLLNTVLFLELEKTDFANSDFDHKDLIHLLLIYISYPTIFRKIYNTETGGKYGFFSLVSPTDTRRAALLAGTAVPDRHYANSAAYLNYTKDMEESPRFLLEKVFNASERLGDVNAIKISEEQRRTYACFNNGTVGGNNLERYLELIVKLSKPQNRDQFQFYRNQLSKLRSNPQIELVFANDEFAISKDEASHESFWRIVINSRYELGTKVGRNVINQLIDHLPDYALFVPPFSGLGLRRDLHYFLVKLLDTYGYSDKEIGYVNNQDENVVRISSWVLGLDEFSGNGVCDRLSVPSRGVLGLYDLVAFRLYCNADRGGDAYNLYRALCLHGDPKAPTTGPVVEIAKVGMREISQRVYRIFWQQYINPAVNVFSLVDELTYRDLAAQRAEYLQEQLATNAITQEELEAAAEITKNVLKGFIVFQLGNSEIQAGVGCGLYDEIGLAHTKGISKRISAYLFDVCFNPAINRQNYEYFLDYLLINLASDYGFGERAYTASIEEFTKVLDAERLTNYWRENRQVIKGLRVTRGAKVIRTANYTTTYEDALEEVFDVLDRLVTGQ